MFSEETFIIAEAGVNHNGDLRIAKKLIDVAVDAGANAVKFQTFKAENVMTKDAPKAEYHKKTMVTDRPLIEIIRKLELGQQKHQELLAYCKERRIIFISSPFDLESIDLLMRLGLGIFKIPSGEITNLPYLIKIGRLKKKVIMSTGMSDIKEIRKALDILIKSGTPKKNITILHCNTEYPTPFEDVNLLAMLTIKNIFNIDVGYSDHTLGTEVPLAAVALGAAVIEKHFTLDKDMEGPDHRASLEPHELKAMVKAIRNIEKTLGGGAKKPSPSEIKNKVVARKSIVAARDIKRDEFFKEENITVKRPGTGLSPMKWGMVIGKQAKRDFRKDELIRL